jgi:PAS domain S-box-containing protein
VLAVGGWLALGTLIGSPAALGARAPRLALQVLLIGDLLATAVAVRIAGDLGGPTLLLLAVPVLAGGLLLQWRAGLILGLLAAVVSQALALLPHGRALGAVWPVGIHYAGAFAAIGLAAGFLGARVAGSLREAAASRAELEAVRLSTDRILESLGCGVIAVDGAGRVQTVNREARRLLGLEGPPEEMAERIAAEFPALHGRLTRPRDPAGVREGECRLRPAGRRAFPAWIKLAPVVDGHGRLRGRVLLFWDLTERKRLERAARRSLRLSSIAELSGGLAHEIRNSLKPMVGCVELLQSQGLLPPPARPMVEVITREADALEVFLSQFLTLARDKALKLEALDIEELIGREARSLEIASGPTGARVVVESGGGVRVRGDRDWLRQVFRNLVLNGMEAKPDGTVRVGFRRFRRRGRPWVRVTVADDGAGIAPEDRRRVFRPFWSGKPSGTGLGLTIALRGVRQHGGRIHPDPRRSAGTTIRVDLPLGGPADRESGSLAA